jgi:hypothetical protein
MKDKLTAKDLDRLATRFSTKKLWCPRPELSEYFNNIDPPSRDKPNNYFKAGQTKQFAKWLIKNHPLMAQRLELIGE